MAVVLADTAPWTYVGATYAIAVVVIGSYAGWVIRRGRKIGRQLPPEERTWS